MLLATFLFVVSSLASTAQAFGPALDSTQLEAETARLQKLRADLGDQKFAAEVVKKWQAILLLHPREHPLHAELVGREGTPEHEMEVNEYFYWASPAELAKTHDRAALPVLKNALALRTIHSNGNDYGGYFGYHMVDRLAQAYLEIALHDLPADKRLAALIDYLDANPQDQAFEEMLAQQQDIAIQLLEFLSTAYPRLLQLPKAAPADLIRMGQLIGKNSRLGITSPQLLERAGLDAPAFLRDLALIALAQRKDSSEGYRQAMLRELKDVLDEFAKPATLTEGIQARDKRLGNRITYLLFAVESRPLPEFKPLVLRTQAYSRVPLWTGITKAFKIQLDDYAALMALAQDPSVADRGRATILQTLVRADFIAAKPMVIEFVKRLGLKAIGHENEDAREFYPDLDLDSVAVQGWLDWAAQGSPHRD